MDGYFPRAGRPERPWHRKSNKKVENIFVLKTRPFHLEGKRKTKERKKENGKEEESKKRVRVRRLCGAFRFPRVFPFSLWTDADCYRVDFERCLIYYSDSFGIFTHQVGAAGRRLEMVLLPPTLQCLALIAVLSSMSDSMPITGKKNSNKICVLLRRFPSATIRRFSGGKFAKGPLIFFRYRHRSSRRGHLRRRSI